MRFVQDRLGLPYGVKEVNTISIYSERNGKHVSLIGGLGRSNIRVAAKVKVNKQLDSEKLL